MDELQKLLEQEASELRSIIKRAEFILDSAPEGHLRVSQNHGKDQYYLRSNPKDDKGVYLKKSELEIAKKIAQRDYAKKMKSWACSELQKFEQLTHYKRYEMSSQIFDSFHEGKGKLIHPFILSEEMYANTWINSQQKKKAKLMRELHYLEYSYKNGDEPLNYTEKGEIVRSKSEKILADHYHVLGIPYIYELPIRMKGFGYIKPDFTLLNKHTRKVYIHEHFGMMDQAEYCEKAMKKIELYQLNHFYVGKNLLLTYESSGHMLNMKIVDDLIREFLLF